MIQINEQIINRIINETINEAIFGNKTEFIPYTPEEKEQNFKALKNPKNKTYEDFMKWKQEEIKKGRNKNELSFATYIKENGFPKLY